MIYGNLIRNLREIFPGFASPHTSVLNAVTTCTVAGFHDYGYAPNSQKLDRPTLMKPVGNGRKSSARQIAGVNGIIDCGGGGPGQSIYT